MRVHHIGYIVDNTSKAIREFAALGYEIIKETQYDSVRDIDITFIANSGMVIELVMPKSKESVIYKLAGKFKNMPYHICYESEDLQNEIKKLEKRGYIVIQKPEKASAINNKKVAFLMHLDIGMIELVEKNEGADL